MYIHTVQTLLKESYKHTDVYLSMLLGNFEFMLLIMTVMTGVLCAIKQ